MVSVDIKRDWLRRPRIFQAKGRKARNEFWLDFLKRVVSLGAGEVLLNSVEKDGTLSGPDLSIIQDASCNLSVPLIALGGISNLEDVKACVDVGASAVAAGSFFVFFGPHRAVLISYPKYSQLEKLFKYSE